MSFVRDSVSQLGSKVSAMTEGIPSLDQMREGMETTAKEAAWGSLDLTYITPRLMVMNFPASSSTRIKSCVLPPGAHTRGHAAPPPHAASPPSRLRPNDAGVVASMLTSRHGDKFMVWNLSEEEYDADAFHNQVLTYKFPGYPAPPLGLLFKLATTMEGWLAADPANVAVVHCMNGRGRSLSVAAVLLAWMGQSDSPLLALDAACEARGGSLDTLSIPSQRRYMGYFASVLQGIKPRSACMVLRSVTLHGVPAFGEGPEGGGCAPYLQVFKGGELLHSSLRASGGELVEPAWVPSASPSVTFDVGVPMCGDILLRCRHLGSGSTGGGVRVTIFRAAFHTGFISDGLLRFSKTQLDMAASDPRYPTRAYVECKFEPMSSETPEGPGTVEGPFDAMLSALDSYWGEIATRKERREAAAEEARAQARAAAAAEAQGSAAGDASAGEQTSVPPPTLPEPAFGIAEGTEEATEPAPATPSTAAAAAAAGQPASGDASDDDAALFAEIDALEAMGADIDLVDGEEGGAAHGETEDDPDLLDIEGFLSELDGLGKGEGGEGGSG